MESQGINVEVRRLHIIYFISRKGRIEHPHLIRVHHFSRNGIRLRDVKRWLGELRGKEMPESFAWSYKRKYKSGYVWQDLVDEDLITPISDNEYVLKGSEICLFTSSIDNSLGEKKHSMQKEPSHGEVKDKPKQETQETIMVIPRKSSSEIEEEFPLFGSETSTLTDDSIKIENSKCSRKTRQENTQENDTVANSSSSSLYSTLLNKKAKTKNPDTWSLTSSRYQKIKEVGDLMTGEQIASMEKTHLPSSTTKPSFNKSKSHSNGASQIFRNLITCGAVDTHDSVMVAINKRNKPSLNMSSSKGNHHKGDLCKWEKLGGSARIHGTPWERLDQDDARKSCDGVTDSTKFCNPRTSSSAAYMPVNQPTCSQCGKQFKPEKLHRHMKSCKGKKVTAKGINSAEKTSQSLRGSSQEDSVSGYYLTH